jgi:hypothetical protein
VIMGTRVNPMILGVSAIFSSLPAELIIRYCGAVATARDSISHIIDGSLARTRIPQTLRNL